LKGAGPALIKQRMGYYGRIWVLFDAEKRAPWMQM
jgi:hypothetical protein